ncbi:DNA polymerase subunit gamma-2, mitochondrial isoform X2 [Ooceraea biroi]|uniref:DNA polymerase subunit gamma-2, mitochondrial isoform X2 n=1 Tax=Ooceraea biroi TaxID=2015173 RepID=UPI0005B7B57D|nr:DNA polymerase subunit gamma-2, mitochondrial isoform X2 [Ooceraea biroi]
MNLEAILRIASPHFLNLCERIFTYGPQDTLQLLRSSSMDSAPFALAVIATSRSAWNEPLLPAGRVSSHKIAKVNVIVDASESKSLLQRKQRERKVWWRKLVQSPSRFVLAEAKKAKGFDVTEIEAQFPFGNITVETITHYPGMRKLFPQTENSKDNVADVHIVEHVTSLDWGCLALLCDSYMSNKSTRAYIHPKLSPYKTVFRIVKREDDADADAEDLNRFVLYLNNMLRTRGISTVLTDVEEIVEMCLIPFIVSVDGTSLKNGIVHVKNRSTTLEEAVHVTDLVQYITLRTC